MLAALWADSSNYCEYTWRKKGRKETERQKAGRLTRKASGWLPYAGWTGKRRKGEIQHRVIGKGLEQVLVSIGMCRIPLQGGGQILWPPSQVTRGGRWPPGPCPPIAHACARQLRPTGNQAHQAKLAEQDLVLGWLFEREEAKGMASRRIDLQRLAAWCNAPS